MKISSQLFPVLETQNNAGYNSGMGFKRTAKNSRGQVAILFALVFTFMFVLFAFVVDFGHLIQNKMNLQIAADAAAYAGAAWQARALNQLGAVNYHMRQDYKEMVMRFQVTHTRHNLNFPRSRGDLSGPIERLPDGYTAPMVCQQAHGFETVRGRRYANNTNLCRNADPRSGGLPPIVVPPVLAPFDPFSVALAQQIKEIQRQADIECDQGRDDNRRLVQHLVQVFGCSANGCPQGAAGLRGNFHRGQIEAIQRFINEAVTENTETSQHPMVAAARESILKNLTDSNKNGEFKFEILPPEQNTYLELKPMIAKIRAYYFDFQSRGSACVAIPGEVPFDALLGFEKDSRYLTYFAVKLTSKPKMLFMPQAWLEASFPTLEAYALAKPFGSRIGPKPQTDGLIAVDRPGIRESRLLDFSVVPGNFTAGGGRSAKLLAYYDSLHPYNELNRPQGSRNTGWPEPFRGDQLKTPLQAVRTPTIFDALFYTVFPDPGENINRDYEEPEFAQALYPDYLEAAGPNNEVIQNRAPASAPYLKSLRGNRGEGWIRVNAPDSFNGPHYGTYASEHPGTHSVTGPSTLPGMSDSAKAREFGFATKEIYHSAWAPPGEPENGQGRIGYGVKYLSIDTLQNQLENRTSSGEVIEIINKPRFDPNLRFIKH